MPQTEAVGHLPGPRAGRGQGRAPSVAQGAALTTATSQPLTVPSRRLTPAGLRAIAVPLSEVDSVGALLQPGDWVDVLLSMEDLDGLNPVVVPNTARPLRPAAGDSTVHAAPKTISSTTRPSRSSSRTSRCSLRLAPADPNSTQRARGRRDGAAGGHTATGRGSPLRPAGRERVPRSPLTRGRFGANGRYVRYHAQGARRPIRRPTACLDSFTKEALG